MQELGMLRNIEYMNLITVLKRKIFWIQNTDSMLMYMKIFPSTVYCEGLDTMTAG